MTDKTSAGSSKDHNYPPCIGENGPMTSGDCARWLEAKYSRHHELEDQASAQMIRNQADEIHRLRAIIAGNEAHGNETNARQEKLETALRGLYWDNVDYLTLNHLGGMDNHWMKAAREALGIRGELKANDPLAQLEDDATFGEIVEEIQAKRGEDTQS